MRNSRLTSAILSAFAVLLMTGLQASAQKQPSGRGVDGRPLGRKAAADQQHRRCHHDLGHDLHLRAFCRGYTQRRQRFAARRPARPAHPRRRGLQNLNDVLFLNNMDMGVADQDNIMLLKQKDPQLYAGLEKRVNYITKLYNSELHVLARQEIRTFADLKGKKVSFNLKDSQSEVTAIRVFNMLNLQVERQNMDVDTAIGKLLNGEIAATIMLTGAPQVAIAKLKSTDGVHLLSLDDASLPGYNLAPVFAEYLPGELTHDVYPNLIPAGRAGANRCQPRAARHLRLAGK